MNLTGVIISVNTTLVMFIIVYNCTSYCSLFLCILGLFLYSIYYFCINIVVSNYTDIVSWFISNINN